jgi:hypothetical protein
MWRLIVVSMDDERQWVGISTHATMPEALEQARQYRADLIVSVQIIFVGA